ncbi:transposase [Peribacillus asahii]|uniref:Transposase n=1 Tax=Peribacillus asahii TaxID=228899 RepID=A0A3Q9RJB3_9BACI|nr:transposase [Peribacillus asahii]
MKKNWNEEELLADFVLMPNELHLSMVNKTDANRLGFALLLKYFQQEAKFPSKKQEIPKVIVKYIAKQLDISPDSFDDYSWGGKEKTYTRHRKSIRDFFGFRELTYTDNERFGQWLEEQVPLTHDTDYLTNQAYSLFRKWKVETND